MRFTGVLFLCCLLSSVAQARDLGISLFDDDGDVVPNLGQNAPALNQLHITPPPFPDITIDLTTPTHPEEPEKPEPEETYPPSEAINLNHSGAVTQNQIMSDNKPKGSAFLHNVYGFDIHGFYLGMDVTDVLNQADSAGYIIKQVREDLPRFYATDYAQRCHDQGIIIPHNVRDCIRQLARAEGEAYTAQIDLVRGRTEAISFFFTSNNTSNEVYKIVYHNYGDNSLNFTTVNTAKKLQRQKEFWNAIFATYGSPDDSKKMIWGDVRKAYMHVEMYGSAYNATITLTDMQAYALDYAEAKSIEDERPPKNNFMFTE